jgi:hypothetical protein
LISAKVSAGDAVVVSVWDLVDSVTHLMHGNIASLAKQNLVVRGNLSVVAHVANSIHILFELLPPRQVQLLSPIQVALVLFEDLPVHLPCLRLALVRQARIDDAPHELMGLTVQARFHGSKLALQHLELFQNL